VVSDDEQGALRHALIDIEQAAGIVRRKWHKLTPLRRAFCLGYPSRRKANLCR